MTKHSWASRQATLLMVLVAVTGCVSQGPLGVRIKGAQTKVFFGAPTKPFLPNFPAVTPGTPPQPLTPLVTQLFPPPPPEHVQQPTYYPPLAPSCPDAALNSFPAEPASADIHSLPQVGQYRWKQSGTRPFATGAIRLSGFQTRYLRRVTGAAGSQTFQTVELDLTSGKILVSTFRVKNAPVDAVDDAVNPVGLTLIEVDELDAKGQPTPVLKPSPPLVYLPLPVTPGATFSNKSVDTVGGGVLTMDGTIKARQRVDACGDEVDGWLVTSTQSFTPRSGGTITSRSYDYIVATQLGGVIIMEHAKSGSSLDATFSLGQVKPDPLPANVR